jgi:3-oxoacyl-[acyl-carrier protein] reductase
VEHREAIVSSRIVLMTGAASGIGRHFAGVLAKRPDEFILALADVNTDGMTSAFEPGERLQLHRLDITSPQDWNRVVEDTIERFGRIDCLFNIAGGGRPGFFVDQSPDDIEFVIDLNLKGALYGMRAVVGHMVAQGSGHIVNISSLAGVVPTAGNVLYSASKSGLRAASIAAAIELRRHGVYVTVVCPGVVDTPLIAHHTDNPEQHALTYSTNVMLTVEDISSALLAAMEARPLEVTLPRGQATMAKIGNAFPELALRSYSRLKRKGMKRLEQIRLAQSRERG